MKKCINGTARAASSILSALTVAASNFRFAVASFCSPKKNFNRSPTYLVFVRILVGAVLGDGWVGSTPKGDDCLLRDAEKDASKLFTYRSKKSEIPYHNWAIMLSSHLKGHSRKRLGIFQDLFEEAGESKDNDMNRNSPGIHQSQASAS